MRVQTYNINIYRLGNEYKVVYTNQVITDTPHIHDYKNKMTGNKFDSALSRAKSKVLGYALCNDWQFFTTFTLDKQKYNRYDLSTWKKDFSQYLRNTKRVKGLDIKYLLIPEPHKDGAWHMHGLMNGFDWNNDLFKFELFKHPLELVEKGYRYYPPILDKFGFHSFGKVRNKSAVSRYILKYISKGITLSMLEKGQHLYYCSNGLNNPELVDSGFSCSYLTDIDYSNDYMASSWISKDEVEKVVQYLR